MMKILLYLISFILWYYKGYCEQSYFPRQIVFSIGNGTTIIAIDEINQRAYQSIKYSFDPTPQISYALQHFPYATPDSPQSNYYVQLLLGDTSIASCEYTTYWKYGGYYLNVFPSHWLNASLFEIKNYLNFIYKMIHSNNSSLDEDYWYTNEKCEIEDGIVYRGFRFIQTTINYNIISIGKPDDKYFNSIPKNWPTTCEDVDLGLSYYPQSATIKLNKSAEFHVSLSTPPHRIVGNGTVLVQWNTTQCIDCFTLSPKEFTFNINNF
ncbi:unnamed protein product [Rotaria sp. Silwood2]|nr:unnamed protein product [Rotaria sp. Silwood2]CAF3242766.1 unnamed protein product [Rotaria sp. Silwood2]CAF4395667.1 unnamed protein product [Rotaria sp. Silwood2]CAF4416328.1 unnamed protein product [Rotaria sp. Silwood2]CAF4447581.1 unnamed protein product [Rotaria sp. Silwood2]